ncbi:MAG: helix-turn-helix domain-containing protein [Pseudonocardiaceae bacterium]
MTRRPEHLAEQQRALGRYLAALREAAGLYQADIARAVPCHRTTVTHAEAGSQLPASDFWEIADQLVGANGALLARYDELIHAKAAHLAERQAKRRARAHTTAQQLAATSPLKPELTLPALHARENTQRDSVAGGPGNVASRELLRLLSMTRVLVTMPGTDNLPDQPERSFIDSSRVAGIPVGGYATLNEHLWRVFVLSEFKGSTLPLVRNQLDVLVASLGQSTEYSTRQRLGELASELLQLAGEIFFDANKYSDAAHCYTLAAAAGNEAGAYDLWACAMTRHAFIEIHEQHFDKALSMLELAARLTQRGNRSLSTRYWVAAVQAQAFAGLGQSAACYRALDAAEQVRALPGDTSNGGWLRFDSSRLAEERSACYVQLRRPDLAEATLDAALRQNLSARRRGSVLTDLAMIGIQRGDVNQLVTHADMVLEIAARTGSGFIGRKLQGLQGHLTPLLGNSRVRQIDQRITAVSQGVPEN